MKRIAYKELEHAGRIGNQAWEVASTLGFARAYGVEPLFPPTWSYRPWFSLPDLWFDGDLERAVPAQKFSKLPGIQIHYLQQWSYIKDVIGEVRDVFTPSWEASEVLAAHLAATDQTHILDLVEDGVTVHIRRGDALDPVTHPVGTWPTVTMDYYREALARFDWTAPLVMFSDDPDWCREHSGDFGWQGPVTVVHGGPTRSPDYEPAAYFAEPAMDWVDLQLMSMFTRHVVANSTYSLWGALLGPGPTVYPDNWCGFVCRHAVPDERTMVPPDWIQVPNPVDEVHLRAV